MRAIVCFFLLCAIIQAGDRPNIVFILADDMGRGDLRCYTNTTIAPLDSPVVTPHIDSIAAAGMTFNNAHSPSAVCSPTRYGVLTGRYAWRSRLKQGVVRAYERALIEPGRSTVGSLLQGQGYLSAAIGKWHLGMNWQDASGTHTQKKGQVDHSKPILEGPVARGFDYYYGDDIINWGPYRWIENDRALDPKLQPHVPVDVMPTIARKSVAYIRQRAASDKPFFLYVPLTAPHAPIVPMNTTPELEATYSYGKLKKYEQFIATVDWTVGQVLQALDMSGLRDKTLIVFTADNGVSKNFASSDHISPRLSKWPAPAWAKGRHLGGRPSRSSARGVEGESRRGKQQRRVCGTRRFLCDGCRSVGCHNRRRRSGRQLQLAAHFARKNTQQTPERSRG